MSQPLDYASPSLEPLPPSEAASDSLVLTGVWVCCLGLTLIFLVANRFGVPDSLALGFGAITLMAMLVFVPLSFLLALLGIADRHHRRTSAYVCAAINGAILMVAAVLVAWRSLL